MLSLIVSIIALGVIIMIHELGHFLAARAMGVGVIEFSIGMGPKLCSKVAGNVRYSLKAFPFGGSCMMLGEELDECNRDGDYFIVDGRRYQKDAQFVTKPAWKRFIVIFAGPAFNFILAFLLSLVICAWFGFDKPYIREVEAGGPAAEAGIEPGDSIYAVTVDNSRMTIQSSRDLKLFMYIHAEELDAADTYTVYYRDRYEGNIRKQAIIKPFYDNEAGRYRLGFSYNAAYDRTDGIIDTIVCSQYNVNYCIRSSIESLKLIAKGKVTRQDVMGPVRMVAVMDETVNEAADYGLKSSMLTLFDLMLLISGSLGFMNLMPLPALDGGRLIFIIIELVTRRAVPKEFEAKIHTAGMMMLLGLMLFIMINDISMLIFK